MPSYATQYTKLAPNPVHSPDASAELFEKFAIFATSNFISRYTRWNIGFFMGDPLHLGHCGMAGSSAISTPTTQPGSNCHATDSQL